MERHNLQRKMVHLDQHAHDIPNSLIRQVVIMKLN